MSFSRLNIDEFADVGELQRKRLSIDPVLLVALLKLLVTCSPDLSTKVMASTVEFRLISYAVGLFLLI